MRGTWSCSRPPRRPRSRPPSERSATHDHQSADAKAVGGHGERQGHQVVEAGGGARQGRRRHRRDRDRQGQCRDRGVRRGRAPEDHRAGRWAGSRGPTHRGDRRTGGRNRRAREGAPRGGGPGCRIVRRDAETVLAAAPAPPAPVTPLAPPAPPAAARPAFAVPPRPAVEFEDIPLTSMRAAIAKRMPLSKGPVPHFYVTSDVAMDRAWELRTELNALEGSPKVSVTDLVIRACALALRRLPAVNASFQGQAVRVYHRAHIGIAVALEGGLITPVLRDCDAKPLAQIAAESRDLAERARIGKLRVQEIAGATFSISNLGMFDVEEFSAIINPPEGAILAVGSVLEKPVADGGQIRVGRRMKMTLSCDHRVIDGATGARFLQDVKRLLEEPLRLLV